MVRFAVDPDALDAAADAVTEIRADAGHLSAEATADVGHAALSSVVSQFMSAASDSWRSRVQELEEISSRLRASAEVYQRADIESAPASGD
jgi:replicative DNA helicase